LQSIQRTKALLLEMAQAWIRIAEQQKLISLSEGQRVGSVAYEAAGGSRSV
jgi:hypothetical protein